jgi:autotransporter strand-loop-strand O-heptosyltransferase
MKITYQEGIIIEFNNNDEHLVEYLNNETNEIIYSERVRNISKCSVRYFVPWKIIVDGKVVETLNLENKNVLISINTDKTIGDLIAYIPYVVTFKNKHKCNLYVKTPNNKWFESLEKYKGIHFIENDALDYFIRYDVGWYRDENNNFLVDWVGKNRLNTKPLQQTSSDILGLEYQELNLGIVNKKDNPIIQGEYIVICPEATMRCKEWTDRNWIELTKLINNYGIKVISLTKRKYNLPNIPNYTPTKMDDIINILYNSKFMIGLSSGLSWVNWALFKHTFMIAGFTDPFHEFQSNITRFHIKEVCISCWTNPNYIFDSNDLEWCPIHKFDDNQFICQKAITPFMVFEKVLVFI